jgi:hypothetical protein
MSEVVEVVKPRGLSPSSFSEYSACQRKWFLRKVLKAPIDSDATEDYSAFMVGKAFHKALEDTKHSLTGYTHAQCVAVCAEFDVTDDSDVLMIYAMLGKYKELHAQEDMRVIACEVVIDVPEFYGITDVVMQDTDGCLWIVDIKTAATFQQSMLATVSSHPQLNLYAKYFDQVAYAVGLKDAPFGGIRLRTTTKSKLIRKATESATEYIVRMSKGIKSNEIVVPKGSLNVAAISSQHLAAFAKTSTAKAEDIEKFPCNLGNCMAYFRPCNYYSRCNAHNYTAPPAVKFLEV